MVVGQIRQYKARQVSMPPDNRRNLFSMYMHVGECQGNIEVRTKMAMMPVQAKCVQLGHIKQGNAMQCNNTLRQLTFSLFSLEKK